MVSWMDPPTFVCPVCEAVYPRTASKGARETIDELLGTLDAALELAQQTGRPVTANAVKAARAILLPKEEK